MGAHLCLLHCLGSQSIRNSATVKIKIPLTFAYGDATQSVQSILDAIFPYLLPVLVTFGVYKGLGSKKMTTVRMVWLIIIICIVLSFFGIL